MYKFLYNHGRALLELSLFSHKDTILNCQVPDREICSYVVLGFNYRNFAAVHEK